MSNPAIVLMTDPSRCSLGDVHYLLQALREMQQMGEHAVPQAFCDHPAAAKGFIEAYAHAYPQLVLQDGGIPTPDLLQSLIANGQIGALGQPAELAPFGGQVPFGVPRPAEQGSGGFPIVVLTLGSSQVLIDAMRQSPAMKESIRLIDIVPDGAGSPAVSIADTVAHGGLDGDGAWDADGLGSARPELDEVAGASIHASGDLAFEHDPLDLGGVDTDAAAAASEAPGYYVDEAEEPATFAPAQPEAPAPAPAQAAVEPAAEPVAAEAAPAAEPAPEQVSAVATTWQDDSVADEPAEAEALEDDTADDHGTDDDGPPENAAGGDDVEDADQDDEPDYAAGNGELDDDDDVYYPPVGDLLSGSDVLYPSLDQAAAQGVLQELVSVLLDDAIFDPDQAFEGLSPPPDDGALVRLRVDEQATIRSSEHVVTIEDLYGTFDQESEDVFADSGAAHTSHDTDL